VFGLCLGLVLEYPISNAAALGLLFVTCPMQFSQLSVTVCCDSVSDGLSFHVRTIDEDYDSLLGQRQRWMEDTEADVNGSTSLL